ncbi:Amine oxidase [Macrophomina phaseolina MS6]|uniref:monoamine oxidase n=1 Tax=Macrophomina phaseolina (strain MS6) TaxID=1126212 RepID=K2RRZ6_MACPH|nr:Amine oxidase [Macrophomina phaseolina MS6]
MKCFYDVIVIGAGFAGLVAARDLSKENLSVLLIEGRDRIGGRTWTAKELGEEFEMGGTWIHWNQPHVYAELSRYNLHRSLKTSSGTAAPSAHFYKPASSTRSAASTSTNTGQANEALETPCQAVADAFFSIDGLDSHTLMPYPHDPLRKPAQPWHKYDKLTIKDRLDQLNGFSQADKDIFDAFMSSLGSAPGSETGFVESLRWYALGGHSMASMFELAGLYKLGNGGMTAFAKKVFGEYRGDVVAGAVVKSVHQDGGKSVAIATRDGREFEAGQVICTVPLNCLSDIQFAPPLAALKQEAISQGHINRGAKIHFKLSETAKDPWFALASGYSDSPWCFSFSDHSGTSASAGNDTFAIGFGYNDRLPEDPTTPGAAAEITSSFKKHLLPTEMGEKTLVSAYLTHPWHADPLAKGVWSCWGPGAMSAYLRELQLPHGHVIFANADWADGWRGFVDGAIERGYRAVRDILELRATDRAGEESKAKL